MSDVLSFLAVGVLFGIPGLVLVTDFRGWARRYTRASLDFARHGTVARRGETPARPDERFAFAFGTVRVVGAFFAAIGTFGILAGAFLMVVAVAPRP